MTPNSSSKETGLHSVQCYKLNKQLQSALQADGESHHIDLVHSLAADPHHTDAIIVSTSSTSAVELEACLERCRSWSRIAHSDACVITIDHSSSSSSCVSGEVHLVVDMLTVESTWWLLGLSTKRVPDSDQVCVMKM